MSVRVGTPLPPSVSATPPPVQEPASAQQHLARPRKKSRVAVRILSANANSQCSASAYGGYSASAESTTTKSASVKPHSPSSAPIELPSPSNAFVSTALSVSAAASSRVYCYAVAFRAAEGQENFGLLRPAIAHENVRDAHALLATSPHAAITRVQGVEEQLTKRLRMRTVVPRALEQFPRIACTALPCALNCARPSRNDLFTSCAPPPRDDLLPTSECDLTPTVLLEWQHSHCNAIALAPQPQPQTVQHACAPLLVALRVRPPPTLAASHTQVPRYSYAYE